MKTAARALLAIVLLVVAGVFAKRAVDETTRASDVSAACDAVSQGAFDTALALSDGVAGADEIGLLAAECRCAAEIAKGAVSTCAARVEDLLRDPAADTWVPPSALAELVMKTRSRRGDLHGAAALAARMLPHHAEDPAFFGAALDAELLVGDGVEVLERAVSLVQARGLSRGPHAVVLAARFLQRNEAPQALAVLGARPLEKTYHPLIRARWFEYRMKALSVAADADGVNRTADAWRAAEITPDIEVLVHQALCYSTEKLKHPTVSTEGLSLEVLERMDELEDAELGNYFYDRIIGAMVLGGLAEEALKHLEDAKRRFGDHPSTSWLDAYDRDDILRSQQLKSTPAGQAARGRLRFDVRGLSAGTLRVSPGPDDAVDDVYQAMPLRDDPLTIERAISDAPLRWVLVDDAGLTRASGAHWVVADEVVDVVVNAGPAMARPPRFVPAPQKSDGRRRVFLLVPDCGDWRILQYLRARGEVPAFDAVIRGGHRGVLWSEPAYTGAAMQKLVSPRTGPPSTSLLGLIHEMGDELGGLSSVGENPFAALANMLPKERNFFDVVGEGDHAAANLLFSHGTLGAGRNAVITGPRGASRAVRLERMQRSLTVDEKKTVLRADVADNVYIREIAAGADAAIALVGDAGVDVGLIRIEALDLITHDRFAEAIESGQDDGAPTIFDAYRYLDTRVAELVNALDGDDVLIIASDHGIRTPLEHDPQALFVAYGGGVQPGRLEGRPRFEGLPRVLASLLGIDVPWPETGISKAVAGLVENNVAGPRALPPAPATR